MAKLTKKQIKQHAEAMALLKKDVLTEDDRYFVLDNWQESAEHINSAAGAFFTPTSLADSFAIEVGTGRIIDLCAGIGSLGVAVIQHTAWWRDKPEIVCVEINPAYVEIGRKVLPEATWICADVFDVLDMGLGRFDVAMSNPPFGRIARAEGKGAPRYKGADFEFHVIDVAAHLANFGAFILPQGSAGFEYSGKPRYERQTSGKAFAYQEATGLHFEAGCGIDTSFARDQWRGTAPVVEVVCVDFTEKVEAQEAAPEPAAVVERPSFAPAANGQFDMFGEAA